MYAISYATINTNIRNGPIETKNDRLNPSSDIYTTRVRTCLIFFEISGRQSTRRIGKRALSVFLRPLILD